MELQRETVVQLVHNNPQQIEQMEFGFEPTQTPPRQTDCNLKLLGVVKSTVDSCTTAIYSVRSRYLFGIYVTYTTTTTAISAG